VININKLDTCEEIVHKKIHSYFNKKSYFFVSYHPPNSKRYKTPNVRFPKINGNIRKGRDIVDFIFMSKEELLLIEAKCKLSETKEDQKKLERILSNYSITDMLSLFKRYGVNIPMKPTKIVKCLAVKEIDTESIPKNFRIYYLDNDVVKIYSE